jgi:mono/diheme cytochrome c family protein
MGRLPLLAAALLLGTTGLASLAAQDGAKLFEDNCAECHYPKKKPLDKHHLGRAKWAEWIDDMVAKEKLEKPLSKEDYATLLDWLVKNHGPEEQSSGAGSDKPVAK